MQLVEFQILTFDCYGTLIDWETGITEALRPFASPAFPDSPEALQYLKQHYKLVIRECGFRGSSEF
jgi:FMN phosphatase YigB (HAD superfamily)